VGLNDIDQARTSFGAFVNMVMKLQLIHKKRGETFMTSWNDGWLPKITLLVLICC
jgi:hypothetical protein